MLAAVGAHLAGRSPTPAPSAAATAAAVDNSGLGLAVIVGDAAAARSAAGGLTAEEESAYRRDGLVVPCAQLSAATTAMLEDVVVQTLAVTCAAEPPVEMPVAPHCPTNLYGAHGAPIPEEVAAVWMALCRHPAILDRVATILGEDFILWGAQLFHKPAEKGLEVPWHQDGRYWPIHPPASVSVWVAVDEADEANGAMGFIPGSHAAAALFEHDIDRNPTLALHQVLDFGAAGLREADAALNVLPPGGFSLHDVYLVHNSRPNRSPSRRAGFVMRYMPASSLFDPSRLPDGIGGGLNNSNSANFARPIFLVRGNARANAAYPGLVDATPERGAPSPEAIAAAQAAARESIGE
jgi:hypothetical protein